MQTKLHINISQGVVDVEGDPELVREIYADFKDKLLSGMSLQKPQESGDADGSKEDPKRKPKRRSYSRKKASDDEDGSNGVVADSPQIDKNLDTSGLGSFYGEFEPKNNPEKILIFLKFLTEQLGISDPNTDQIYTCYEAANERVPKVFSQAFRDASGRKFGYIDYNSPTDISITTLGSNHFKFDMKRKAAE
ncbi:MAG TPA: hypothetical protein DD437_01130 [Rhodobiaceae bacterium]|nr:hypothetical protein [Rhodobiaceae bacterium]